MLLENMLFNCCCWNKSCKNKYFQNKCCNYEQMLIEGMLSVSLQFFKSFKKKKVVITDVVRTKVFRTNVVKSKIDQTNVNRPKVVRANVLGQKSKPMTLLL